MRGWVFNFGTLEEGNWAAHSVIKRPWQPLTDITLPIGCLFLRHHGDEAQFQRLRRTHPAIWLPLAAQAGTRRPPPPH